MRKRIRTIINGRAADMSPLVRRFLENEAQATHNTSAMWERAASVPESELFVERRLDAYPPDLRAEVEAAMAMAIAYEGDGGETILTDYGRSVLQGG